MGRLAKLLLLIPACQTGLVVPLYDEAPTLARHPGLRGRVVLADHYVPGPPPGESKRWVDAGRELAVHDTLRMQAEGIDREFVIPADGRVDFPRVGLVPCARRKIDEVRDELIQFLRGEPVRLSVLVVEKDADIWIVGMVSHQGRVKRGAETLSQAVAFSGFLSRRSCLPQIVVVRSSEGKAIVCDYYRYAKDKDERQNVRLFPGDVIVATALYNPDHFPCAPEWGPIEHFLLGRTDRAGLLKALRK